MSNRLSRHSQRLQHLLPLLRLSQLRHHGASSCRRPGQGLFIPRLRLLRWLQPLPRRRAQAASSVDARFSIAGPLAAPLSGLLDRPELPASAVQCTRPAVHRAAHRRDPGPALASALAVPVRASDSAPELPALFRLQVKRRGRSGPVRVSGAAARHTRRPKKAR